MLALSIREAVINVTKHSKASTCKITLDLQDGYYQVVIRDNGIGLDLKGDGYGIYSMQERLKLVKGDATIDSEGQGVQVQFRLPVLAERWKFHENHHCRGSRDLARSTCLPVAVGRGY